jgi:hypothetical protein
MFHDEERKNTSAKAKFGFLIIYNHLKFNLAESAADYQVIAVEKVTPISQSPNRWGQLHAHG